MIESSFQLHCDKCRGVFVDEGEAFFDAAILTFGEVRRLARAQGWKRWDSRDLCANCARLAFATVEKGGQL